MIEGIRGHWDSGFDNVVHAFAATVQDERAGAALSVHLGGRAVVSVQSGAADLDRPWEANTPAVIFSCTKGVAAVAIAMLLDRGLLGSLDEPLARYWPEFGVAGKSDVSVGDALAHRAGVPGPDRDLTLSEAIDGHTLAENIAGRVPLWRPGTGYSYHTLSHGVITEQLMLRIDGRTLGRFIAEEISGPLGIDLWLGADAETAARRVRPVLGDLPAPAMAIAPDIAEAVAHFATFGGAFPARLTDRDVGFDDPAVIASGLAGAAGLATADAVARFWGAVVDPREPLLSSSARAALTALRGEGAPEYPTAPPPYHRWGAGVALASDLRPMTSLAAFGHDGAGGQVAFADPGLGLGFAYLTNLMIDTARGDAVVRELRSAL